MPHRLHFIVATLKYSEKKLVKLILIIYKYTFIMYSIDTQTRKKVQKIKKKKKKPVDQYPL